MENQEFIGKFSELCLRIISLLLLFWQRFLRFNVTYKRLAGCVIGVFVFTQAQAQAPGGVSTDLKLWLKANVGTDVNTNDASVSQWSDNGTGALHATQSSNGFKPKYKDGTTGINFNPAVAFDGSNDYLENTSGGFYARQYYLVVMNHNLINSSTSGQTPFSGYVDGSSDVTGFHFGAVTARFNNEVVSHNISNSGEWGSALNSNTASIAANSVNVFSVRTNAGLNGTDIYQNGGQINNAQNNSFQEVTNTLYKIGAFEGLDNYFNGKVAEVITFSNRNDDTQKNKIESYLALKYGVHLNSNYVSSSGTTIWDKTANAAYHNDVTGIGQDNNSVLLQKQSTSSNDASLAIGLTSIESTNALNTNAFPGDNSFLVWGHNNASTSIATTINSQLKRMARVWKVANVGNITNVMVRLNSSYFTGPVSETPVLIVSTDATIDANDQIIELQKSGSYQRKLTTLPNGAYFTFGTLTTPPLMIPISYTKN